MHLDKPDPRHTSSPKARRNFALALKISLFMLGVLWSILIVDSVLGLGLTRFGLRPGRLEGLVGIFTAPLLHGGFRHLASNSLPFLVSMTMILYLYPNSAMRAIPLIWVGSGLLGWIIGRPSIHFGASGLVYGLLAYVFVGGMLRMDMRAVAVSIMVWFLYGSMVWGVLPIRPNMSWELHLCGAILGVLLAIVYRKWDAVPLKRYTWEDDDSVPDWFPQSEPERPDTAKDISPVENEPSDVAELPNSENDPPGENRS